jgi:hypothetical protein
MGRVMLIGISHDYQLPGNPAADMFRMFVEQVYATKTFRAIAEEMSLEEVAKRQATQSVGAEVAVKLGVCHRYCDPDTQQRSALGVRHKNLIKMDGWLYDWSQEKIQQEIRTSHSIREHWWLQRLLDLERWPVLFVCGACHVEAFGNLAKAHGLSVDVVAFDWGPAK